MQKATPIESKVQARIVKKLKANGWRVLKVIQLSENGFPDLLCLRHPGICMWVEAKRKGEEARPLQQVRIAELRSLGFKAYVIDNEKEIDTIA